ncbi:AmmeMemoRadiSam system radical SAM enzyme [Sphaerisporangium melleum]|uniref:AmmeMemoRadiSam system radical SAM enzyme n=1 Tax=Sphaerisporangium melleum TaxID=321316 RepID=A0A917RAG6_9ACTN|nr:radical SAM protein [Sphaerisporangium melleum]GGK97331.1 AmmeMemoRadiSam system radical SAM enzyme [Sphaerisporangium melleum]GII71109.1 AmmeMemoRadiSam system radical SAM enzyme [Sphaerisporangium melleum]
MARTGASRPGWRAGVLGEAMAGGRVRCRLCPFACSLAEGRTGPCQVRRNHSGVLETATYAVAVAHLDAVERKPFYHLWPGAKVLTLAAPGCTFSCSYCVNHRLSQYGRETSAPWTGSPAGSAGLAELAERARADGALLGLSYSEPGLAPELTLALADHGLPIVWKTNGFLTAEAIDLVAPVLTAVNIDVKAAESARHRELTGAPLEPVLDAVARFHAAGVWVEASTPLIPGVSAAPDQLTTIARHLAAISPDLPWHLLRFTPDFRMRAEAPTPPAALAQAREIGHRAGLRFVYVERALGVDGRRTTCPACGGTLVDRGIWETLDNCLVRGACPACGTPVPGRWEGGP